MVAAAVVVVVMMMMMTTAVTMVVVVVMMIMMTMRRREWQDRQDNLREDLQAEHHWSPQCSAFSGRPPRWPSG